jgi:hypothetical protein
MTVPFPFVANAVLTAAQLNAITSLPTTAKTASATLTAAESVGYRVTMTSASATTITINTAVFATGDTVFITNLGAGLCTITAGTATVSSSGSLILPQYGSGVLVMTATGTGIWYPSANVTIIGTSLPASPYDGQPYILVDSVSAPTYRWSFQYNANSASAYKWEFIGGTAMQNQINTTETKAAGATYGALTTAGPTITVPRAGDYDVLVGALIGTNTGTAKAAMSFDIGATGAVNANAAEAAVNGVSSTIASARTSRLTGVAASTALTAKYLATSVSSDFGLRYMYATPVRVS